MFLKTILSILLITLFLFPSQKAQAGELSAKLANFTQWEKLTSVKRLMSW